MKEIGEISEVVETPDGFEIIKLTGIREARQKTFDEVKEQIIERERHWEIGNFWEQYAADMRAKANIVWDPEEKLRRDKKEARDRKYNQKIEKQIARQEKRVRDKDRLKEKRPAQLLTEKPNATRAKESVPLTSTTPPTEAASVQ
jgi:hypothetical protein